MRTDTLRRLPAYGRQVRDRLLTGQLPTIGNGTVAVCIDWPLGCPFIHVVCMRDERHAAGWDFDFLAGIDTIVWFARRDLSYADEVRSHLLSAGCPVVAMLQLPEEEQ